MNDFLTSLAARTLGTMPMVVPRLPSRFESASTAGTAALTQKSETPADSLEPPRAGPASGLERPTLTARKEQNGVDPVAQQVRRSPAESPPPRPDAQRADRLIKSAEFGASDVRRADPPTAGWRDTTVTTLTSTPAREPTRVLQSSQPREQSPDPWRRAANAGPAIHVTIGRVDVRAVYRSEPVPTVRKNPETPRLSLGAYLRQRRD